MNIVVWTRQILLALVFGYSGIMKSSLTREKLVSIGQTGVADLQYPLIRFIVITEIFGTVGIMIPWAANILPVLTPVTAICFAIIMVLALPIHYKRKEYKAVILNAVLFCICVFVAYMRTGR